jgi:hypothetical protein
VIFLAYLKAAIDVPASAAILLVPNKTGNGIFGNVISKKGVCIKPPPPTTASIKPAVNADKANNNIVNKPYSLYKLNKSIVYEGTIYVIKKARLIFKRAFKINYN